MSQRKEFRLPELRRQGSLLPAYTKVNWVSNGSGLFDLFLTSTKTPDPFDSMTPLIRQGSLLPAYTKVNWLLSVLPLGQLLLDVVDELLRFGFVRGGVALVVLVVA